MAYMCDSEDGNPADVLVSNLNNGDTLALCANCFPAYVRSLADAMEAAATAEERVNRRVADERLLRTEQAEPVVELQGAVMPATEPGEGEATPSTPSPKRGRSQSQATKATPQDDTPADALPGSDTG